MHPYTTVNERDGVSRNENEKIGGVAETVIPRRDPVDDIVGNVIEEDSPVRNATKHIEPIAAPLDVRRNFDPESATLRTIVSS